MKVTGTKRFDAPAQDVWDVLNDPEELASLMPGVSEFEIHDEHNWTAHIKVPLGVGGLKVKFDFEKIEARPIEHAALRAKGKGVGAIISMETQFDLTPDGATTSMEWIANVNVLGQVGSMGQRVLQPIVNRQVNICYGFEILVECIEAGNESLSAMLACYGGATQVSTRRAYVDAVAKRVRVEWLNGDSAQ